ncbi:response regulator [Mastigocoleus testarum]|uniref:LuxR family transcriptional regulator n=1 Tax=Mastigocoleus testarum BC008 TaxID=371196 RepID=A0A0V8A097_9CYAN|nr:response regulator transcription factor [Mastigocoleus testarum]KST70006.1 LuxR family transcriptional regulator [Mastigocoleus testarum BC008]
MKEIKVLIIEDHNLTRIGLKAALQSREDIKIVGEAPNATEGLKLLQIFRPDVATVDIGLPDFDGIELTRKYRDLQAENEEYNTKLLVLTMQSSEDSVLAALGAGADSYCMKDIESEKLIDALVETYEGNSWIDPNIADVVLRKIRAEAEAQNGEGNAKNISIRAIDSDIEKVIESCPLTARELEVLELIVEGCDNATIAKRLFLTVGTVKTHVRGILSKLCVDDRTQAAVRALRSGIVS